MGEKYGSYSDKDLSDWERFPQVAAVLTSSAFGAWLLRRDKNIKKQEQKTAALDKIRAEIWQEYNRLSSTRADETLELGECLGLKMSLKIIDKYRQEGKDGKGI